MNNAATITHMSGGQLAIPLVIRMTTGAGRQVAAQHSHSLEGWLAHIPGLKLLAPATIADARGMLAPALADPNPVLIFEHGSLYNLEGDLSPDAGAVDIERAAIRRIGADVTLVAYGGTLPTALSAAEELASTGIEAEVIDLRVLRLLDDRTIIDSVTRTTARCVRATDSMIVWSSSGRSTRRSITSASMPVLASSSAADRAMESVPP